MFTDLNKPLSDSFIEYINSVKSHPFEIVTFVIDIIIVIFLIYELIKRTKKSKVWQLVKGIALLIIMTILSGLLKLRILNFILTSIMSYGIIALLIIFQPELRRALEQLGSNTFSRMFGIEKNMEDKIKEDIYKVVIAVEELAKHKTGALIVFERDIKLQDIIDTGIAMDCEVSPQVLVNIFVPNTPLHEELGTRHRAAIGISKESDAIAVVVSEETGKVSIAKDGTLIADVKEDALRHILIKYLINSRFGDENDKKRIVKIKEKIKNERIKFFKNKTNQANKS